MAVISAEVWPGTGPMGDLVHLRALIRDPKGAPASQSAMQARLLNETGYLLGALDLKLDLERWFSSSFRPQDYGITDDQIVHLELEAKHPRVEVLKWTSTLLVASRSTWQAWQGDFEELSKEILSTNPVEPSRQLSELVDDFAVDLWTRGRIYSAADLQLPSISDLERTMASVPASLLATRFSAVAHASFAAERYVLRVQENAIEIEASGERDLSLSNASNRFSADPWRIHFDWSEKRCLFTFPIDDSDGTLGRPTKPPPPPQEEPPTVRDAQDPGGYIPMEA